MAMSVYAGHRGDWLASSAAMSVNRQSGIARAHHTGTSIVKYNVSIDSITESEVSLSTGSLFDVISEVILHCIT